MTINDSTTARKGQAGQPTTNRGHFASRTAAPDAIELLQPREIPSDRRKTGLFSDAHTFQHVAETYKWLTEPEILHQDGERTFAQANAHAKVLAGEARARMVELRDAGMPVPDEL